MFILSADAQEIFDGDHFRERRQKWHFSVDPSLRSQFVRPLWADGLRYKMRASLSESRGTLIKSHAHVLSRCSLPCSFLHAVESSPYPLWDGNESVVAYAQRIGLPPKKQIDLGHGFTLDLVLIPAGSLSWARLNPESRRSQLKARNGCSCSWRTGALLLGVLVYQKIRTKKWSFSLRWLLMFTAASGLAAGGWARWRFANQETVRYAAEMYPYSLAPDNEKPGHLVTLTQPFYMGKYTVTQAQYEALTGTNPSHFKGAQNPVETISWLEAKEYCGKLNALLRPHALEARLPTEAEWEYACRAGTRRAFFLAIGMTIWMLWDGTMQTAMAQRTPWARRKLMHSFVRHARKCLAVVRRYDMKPYEKVASDPIFEQWITRMLRGGSWKDIRENCRSATRSSQDPYYQTKFIGFRIVVAQSSSAPH